jgi:hypothetical protein
MLPVATRQDVPRPSPALTESVEPFPVEFAHLLTPEVLAASEAHRNAREAVMHHRAALGAARSAVEQARATDAGAARDAVASGKPPPAPSEPKAAADLDRGERAVVAAEQIARGTQNAYLGIVRTHLAELHGAVREHQNQIREQAGDALSVLHSALTEADALTELLRELDEDGIAGRNPTFRPRVPRRRRDVAAEQLAPVRALLAVEPAAGNTLLTGHAA